MPFVLVSLVFAAPFLGLVLAFVLGGIEPMAPERTSGRRRAFSPVGNEFEPQRARNRSRLHQFYRDRIAEAIGLSAMGADHGVRRFIVAEIFVADGGLLLMQYFKNGYCVAAKKVKCLLNKIKVVMFQHIMNTPIAIPIIAKLIEVTFPKYSGAKNKASAPKLFIKPLFTTLNIKNQKINSTWYFLKCRKMS